MAKKLDNEMNKYLSDWEKKRQHLISKPTKDEVEALKLRLMLCREQGMPLHAEGSSHIHSIVRANWDEWRRLFAAAQKHGFPGLNRRWGLLALRAKLAKV